MLAWARTTRLSEVAMRTEVCLIESSFRQGVCVNLSEGMARLGERTSPKRDNVLWSLF